MCKQFKEKRNPLSGEMKQPVLLWGGGVCTSVRERERNCISIGKS